MQSYIGTKIVNAAPMHKNYFYGMIKGDVIPRDTIDEEGYTIIYEDGYQSWSPKDVFERSYRKITDKEKVIIGLNLL
jgi:hypothetical protein